QTPHQQRQFLTALVTQSTATVLAHPDPTAIDADRPFKDLGIDSLSALELRNSLSTQTGLALPATLIFDHPSPASIADHLAGLLAGTTITPAPIVTVNDDKELREVVLSIPITRLRETGLLTSLLMLKNSTISRSIERSEDLTPEEIAQMDLESLVR